MAKKGQKPAASGGTKSKQPVVKKIKKVTLKAKKSTPSRAKKGFVNPPSVVKVKIKPMTECNDLVPPKSAANIQTPEEEKVVKKCNVNKMQKCKNKLPAGADETISRKKQPKFDNIVKPKASKPRAQRSVKSGKSGDGTLQPKEETGADVMKRSSRKYITEKEKKKVTMALQIESEQMKLDAVAKPDDILKSDTPVSTKKITRKPRTQTKSLKLQRLNEVNAAKKDTKGIKTVVGLVKESVQDNRAEKIAEPRKRKIIAVPSASEKDTKTKVKVKQVPQHGKGEAKECETNQLENIVVTEDVSNGNEENKNTMIKKKKTAVQMADDTKEMSLTDNSIETHEDNLTSAPTDINDSPIFSYLSLVAKHATFKKKFKSSTDKVVLHDTLSVCSGFTWAREISSTSSASTYTSRGYCVPINGKVPIVKLVDIKNSLMYPSIKSITMSQVEEKISESNTAKNMDERKTFIEKGNTATFNELCEYRLSSSKEIDLSSSTSSSSYMHTLSSSISSSENSKTSKNISVDECADLAKVQNILQNIDFSWIDELDQIFEGNDFIKENCNNIISLSHCMSTDKEELQVVCENLQNTLEITKINNEKLLPVTPSLSETEIVQSKISLMDKEILNKPNMEIAAPDCTTIPIQTNISSDFINLDDDVISLYAESLATLDISTVLAKKQISSNIKFLPPIQVGNVKPTVKTQITHTFMKPTKITSAISSTVTHPEIKDDIPKIKLQNPTPTEKVVCKKQSADSTSVLRDHKYTDSETNSYCDPQESTAEISIPQKHNMRENRRDEQMSDEMPCSTIPNCITAQPDRNISKKTLMSSINTKLSTVVFTGVCFRNLWSSCTNRKCQHSHRILSPEDINSRLSVVCTEICVHSYLIMKRYKALCDRYLKVFIKVFASRKLSNILFEIMFDLMWDKIVTDTLECMFLCLDELNTLDITECEDFLLHTLPDQSFFSEVIILFILRLGCFLRCAPILSKLVTLFYERNILLQTETVHEFVKVICAKEMDVEQKHFLKLVYGKCVKNTDRRIFTTVSLTDWDKFGQRLMQVDLETEFEDLWLQIQPHLLNHEAAGLVPEPCVQRSYPDGLIPVESSLLHINKLKTEKSLFVKPPFVRNHTPYRPAYSHRNYGANGPRVGKRHPQKKWTNRVAGADLKFRKNIQPNDRFVTYGGAPRPPNAFTPLG